MVELIPSKDVRELAKEVGWEFSDVEKAAILHNMGLPIEQELAAFEELKGKLTNAGVIAQINVYVTHERELLRRAAEPNGCVFMLVARDEEDKNECPHGIYADLASARETGCRLGVEFRVEKHQILGKGLPAPRPHVGMFNPNMLPDATIEELVIKSSGPNDLYIDAKRASMGYSSKGELIWFYCYEEPPETIDVVRATYDPVNFRIAMSRCLILLRRVTSCAALDQRRVSVWVS